MAEIEGTLARVTLRLSLAEAEALYWSIDKELLADDPDLEGLVAHVEADLAATLEDMGVDLSTDDPDDDPDSDFPHNVVALDVPELFDPSVVMWSDILRVTSLPLKVA